MGPERIASPCVRNCCLDGEDICLGCGRSLAEITAWSGSSEPERRAILERAARRRYAEGMLRGQTTVSKPWTENR
jgi:uncharacterized protein